MRNNRLDFDELAFLMLGFTLLLEFTNNAGVTIAVILSILLKLGAIAYED